MKWGWKLLVVAVLLISLGSLYFIEDKFIGCVVWGPATVVDNCSLVDIVALWDEVFVESSAGITTFDKYWPEGCGSKSYKVVGGKEIYVLEYSLSLEKDTVITLLNGENWRPNRTLRVGGEYLNATPSIVANIESSTSYDDLDLGLDGLEGISNNSVADSVSAKGLFEDLFRIQNLGVFSESVIGAPITYVFNESEPYPFKKDLEAKVVGGKDWVIFNFGSSDATRVSLPPTLLGDIPTFTFEKNSNWNIAFDLEDVFDLDGVNVGFANTGINNTGGEWINYSLTGGWASFKPATGFLGSREFRLQAMAGGETTYSNYFNVTIIANINNAPTLKTYITDVFISKKENLTIYLDQYFEDLDGTVLTYSVSALDNVGVIFRGDDMYIWLDSNFTDYEKFRIIASDGVYSVASNLITISLGEGEALVVELVEDPILVSQNNISAPGIGARDSGGDGESGFWIAIGSGVLMIILIIGVAVYFSVFKKKPISVPVKNTAVNDYLKKINREIGEIKK